MFKTLALLTTTAAAADTFPPCCAFNGDGSVLALGSGVLNAFPPVSGSSVPTGPSYAAPMAIGVSALKSFTTVLFAAASGPEDAHAGWIVSESSPYSPPSSPLYPAR